MLANLLIKLGFTRDDAIWLWGRVVGAAAAIASGVFDLSYWAKDIGITLSLRGAHVITIIAVVILWISGKQDRSYLPPDLSK